LATFERGCEAASDLSGQELSMIAWFIVIGSLSERGVGSEDPKQQSDTAIRLSLDGPSQNSRK
jgi:hypothetical protein